jgi:FKBP-type peptidyl-prolyl cis-trans isomerase FkpA
MKPSRSVCALATCLVLMIAAPAAAGGSKPKTEEEKTLYYLGVLAGGSLTRFDLNDDEIAFVQRGIADVLKGETLELDPQIYGERAQQLMQARQQQASASEKKAAADFVATEARKKGVRTLESGVLIEDIEVGTGDSPSVNDTVVVHYHGTLRDGTVFDSSVERGQPFTTQLSRVVKCWQEGVSAMREGGKARLVCPPELAYGDASPSPAIPGGSALVFEVELIDIVN